MTDKRETAEEIAARVARDRAKAAAAKLPDSLVDYLTVNDASPELFAEAIANWQKHGYWQSPCGAIWWGEIKREASDDRPQATDLS